MRVKVSVRIRFTLIELLVVLSIILLLFTLTLSAFKQLSQKSEQIECVSNFRQIGGAFAGYAADNDSKWPAVSDDLSTGGGYEWPGQWFMHLCAYAGYDEWGNGGIRTSGPREWARYPSELTPNIFACPSAIEGYNAQQFGSNIHLGIGMNGFLYPEALDPDNPPSRLVQKEYPKIILIKNPSTKLAIIDSMNYATNNYWALAAWHRESRPDNIVNRTRHNGSCNALFVDGHVEIATDKEVYDRIFDSNDRRRDKLYHIW